ncbi:MAG TPA: HAMP domain-containing sensor histidine kinase [Thermoanaerobaculia bacterium]
MALQHATHDAWRDVYLDVSAILARQTSFEAAAPALLRTLAGALGWDAAAVWLPLDEDSRQLVCRAVWSATALDCTAFSAILATEVHRCAEARWVDEGGAFPLLSGRESVGVVQWFGRAGRRGAPAERDLLLHVGSLAGLFLESRRFSHELEEARRISSLGRLASVMAHEFGNVLMGIASFAEYLRRHATTSAMEAAAGQIQRSLNRGRKLTDDILRFSRNVEPVLAEIDVAAWLETFLPEAVALAGSRVRLQVEEGLVIQGDVAQLNQVLVNLVLNARDASPADAPIVIAARATTASGGDSVEVAVLDRGGGIPEDVRDRIFEPLFTTKPAGHGIGLAVVQRIVRAHNGLVRVRSESGIGTEFRILLPAEIAGRAGGRERPS